MSKNKITLGYVLSKYRLKSNLDRARLSYKISTDIDYIIALEKGNYKVFKSFNQALPIIKKLSYILGLKYQSLVDLYHNEYYAYIDTHKHNDKHKNRLVIHHHIFKLSGGLMLGGIILGYLILQFYQITYSPNIKLNDDAHYQFYNQEEYKLTGHLVRASQLTLNGQKVTINEDGKFEVLLNLRDGENRIELAVHKDSQLLKTLQKTIYKQ
ncbi:MAG: hypothetical protein ACO3UU_00425 [Minisyncoccia bacterium]